MSPNTNLVTVSLTLTCTRLELLQLLQAFPGETTVVARVAPAAPTPAPAPAPAPAPVVDSAPAAEAPAPARRGRPRKEADASRPSVGSRPGRQETTDAEAPAPAEGEEWTDEALRGVLQEVVATVGQSGAEPVRGLLADYGVKRITDLSPRDRPRWVADMRQLAALSQELS